MSLNIKKNIVQYLHRMKYHFALSFLIFIAFTLLAYYYPNVFQSLIQPATHNMNEGVKNGTIILSTLPLFINNFTVALKIFEGGIFFSIPSVYLLTYNALFIGYTAASLPITYFLSFTLPHGIAELTAIILAGASGFRLTQSILMILSGIKFNVDNKFEFFKSHLEVGIKMAFDSIILLVFIVILLIIAAFIEANLTVPIGQSVLGI